MSGFPTADRKTVASCFNCGRDGHIARDCRQKPTGNVGASGGYGFNVSVSRHTEYVSGAGRGTHTGGVGRDTDNLNRAHGKGCIRSDNGRRELSSNPMTARHHR
jgi:hypothetical protein